LSSFWFTTFIFLSQRRNIFIARRRNYSISCFQIEFTWVLRFYFSLFSQMLAVIVQEWNSVEFGFIFCPPKSIITHFRKVNFLSFCGTFCRTKKEIMQFLVYLSVLHIRLNSFCQYFLIFWLFNYSTLNKRCLETWSCVCGYCAYGLFLCFCSLRNIPKNARELGVGCGQFHSGINGLNAKGNTAFH